MRKKAAMVLVLFMAASAVWVAARDRHIYEHQHALSEAVDQVYSAFITKDYSALAELSSAHNPNHMLHIRQGYGDIHEYKLIRLRSKATPEGEAVEAEVQVISTMENKLHTTTDRLLFMKVEGQWKTWEYATELTLASPSL